MNIDMSQFIQTFFDEASEHLAAMESLLLALDVSAPEAEDLNAIFRAAHSIKGGAATFGFSDLTDVTHILENQLDRVRKGTLALRTDMVDTFLEAGDALKTMLQSHQAGHESDPAAAAPVCAKLHALEGEKPGEQAATPKANSARWRLTLQLKNRKPEEVDFVVDGLHHMGWVADESAPADTAFIAVNNDSAQQITDALGFVIGADEFSLAPYTGAKANADFGLFADEPSDVIEEGDGFGLFAPLQTNGDVQEEGDGFGFFAPPVANNDVQEEGDGFGLFAPLAAPADGVIEQGEGYGLFEQAAKIPANTGIKEEGEGYGLFTAPASPTTNAATPAPVAAPAAGFVERRAAPRPAGDAPESTSIRVGVEKVDQIINLVGELVITQAMLAQVVGQFDPAIHERLHNGIALLERNTRELQESAMSIRMMPISFVFSRFPRVVRDTASKLGKKVRLLTQGENTELDRGLIEKLSDPLTHLVRNSLDHGVERPDVRVAKGKDEQGTLTLKAFHQGGNIIIQVLDDGGGLSRERILAKAKSQGMAVSDAMPDAEVWPLIFEPGFSTAETVTDVSGRGVGMDVVRRNIQGMGGRIDIDTIKDGGTSMTIRLPLTLAILDGMAIRVNTDVYVIPLAFIVESLQPKLEDIKTVSGKGRVVHMRGEYLPVITLHEVFGLRESVEDFQNGLFVVLESDGGKTALFVDDLLGQHQVVIKSLETNFRKVPGVSGATIMGDGRVALIIDVESLVRLSQEKAKAAHEASA